MVHVAVHPEEGRNVEDGTRWAVKREPKLLPGHVTEFSARTAGWGDNVDMKAEQERIDKARKILKRVMSGKTKDNPWMIKPESILSTWCKRVAAMTGDVLPSLAPSQSVRHNWPFHRHQPHTSSPAPTAPMAPPSPMVLLLFSPYLSPLLLQPSTRS